MGKRGDGDENLTGNVYCTEFFYYGTITSISEAIIPR